MLAGGGIWGNIEGKMRPFDNLLTSAGALVAYATGKGDAETKWMKEQVKKLVGGLGEDDRHAARSVGRIVLDRVVARLGYQVELRDEQQPARVDYGGGAVSDRPGLPLTEIQPQDASVAAWEEARRLRQQFQRPQIPRGELQDWQEFNDRGTYDDITQG